MEKEKRYYWIKLKENFFEMPEIDWLLEQENGCKFVVLYLRLCTMTANSDGMLLRKVGEMLIPYDYKKISQITKMDISLVMLAVNLFKKLNLIYEVENESGDTCLKLQDFSRMVGQETKWADYKRNERKKNKELKAEKECKQLDNVQSNVNDKLDNVQSNVNDKLDNVQNNINYELDNVQQENRDKENRDKDIRYIENRDEDEENNRENLITEIEEYSKGKLGSSTSNIANELKKFVLEGRDKNLIKYAIDEAIENNKLSWAYVLAILNKLRREAVIDIKEAMQLKQQYHNTKESRYSNRELMSFYDNLGMMPSG